MDVVSLQGRHISLARLPYVTDLTKVPRAFKIQRRCTGCPDSYQQVLPSQFLSKSSGEVELLHLQGSLDNINLFSIITIMSFFLLAPFTLAREGFQLTHQGLSAIGVVDTNFIFQQALYAALSFHTYQQVSMPTPCLTARMRQTDFCLE